jgi:DNA-binding phage protein
MYYIVTQTEREPEKVPQAELWLQVADHGRTRATPRKASALQTTETPGRNPIVVLTRDFRETIGRRVREDPGFRRALLTEAVETFIAGDVAAGKAALRDYINATIGFETLAARLGKESKSIHRMLGPNGNPRANNIFAIIKILQDEENISLQVRARGNSSPTHCET